MKFKYLLCILTAALLVSCEKTFSLNEIDNTSKSLVANAVVCKDSTLAVSISSSYGIQDAPVKVIRTFLQSYGSIDYGYLEPEWAYSRDVIRFDFDSLGKASEEYKLYAYPEAKVRISVNDKDDYNLVYNADRCMYESDYRPQEGDRIHLYAEGYVDSIRSEIEEITADITIPAHPKVEVLGVRYEYKKQPGEWNGTDWQYLSGDIDTVAYVTLKLHDIPGAKSYYRLIVSTLSWYHLYRGDHWDWAPPNDSSNPFPSDDPNDGWLEGGGFIEIPPWGPFVWHKNDIYRSEDVLFRDDRLVRGFSGWRARFSNVFDDRLFADGEYIVEVETPIMRGSDRKLRVELQSLSGDYYQFWRSWMVYRITADDDFAESIYIHSNVNNGFGIIGAVNSDVHLMDMKIN